MKPLILIAVLAAGLVLAACGGQPSGDGGAAAGEKPAMADTAAEPAETVASAIPPRREYVVAYAADAVYTEEDLPYQGGFLKLDFTGMDPETVNKVIHRLKTENTPCESETCGGLLYEEALVSHPQCDITVRAAKNVIREEKMKAGEWRRTQGN